MADILTLTGRARLCSALRIHPGVNKNEAYRNRPGGRSRARRHGPCRGHVRAQGPAGLDAKAIERGKAEAPALVTAAGLKCTVSNALWIGGAEDKKTKTKSDYYEVACSDNIGFVLLSDSSKPAPTAFSCFEANKPGADGKPGQLACKLPENADQNAKLAPYIAKAGSSCAIDKVRAIGSSATQSFFEIACTGGDGYVMQTAVPMDATKDVALNSCLAYEPGGNIGCEMTDREALLTKTVTALATAANNSCTVKDRRYVLSTKTGEDYFEVACQDGKGYMLQKANTGKFAKAIPCAEADFVGGGCTLTDSRAAQTEQAGLYTKLATKAGFDCQVSKYGILPAPGKEVVELQCSNRPDGAVAIFEGGSSKIFNCATAPLAGYRCSFTKPEAAYPALTEMLKNNKAKPSVCKVANSNVIGTSGNDAYLEVSCGAGEGRLVMQFALGSPELKAVLGCADIKGCKLPN